MNLSKLVKNEDIEGVKKLLKHGEDANEIDPQTEAPILFSCSNPILVKLLLEHGADANYRLSNGNTPLHQCFTVEHAEILVKHGADINAVNNNEETPLVYCISTHKLTVAKFLVNKGADVNLTSKNGSALSYACKDEEDELIDLLLKKRANVNIQGTNKTPVFWACFRNNLSLVEKLIQRGAKIKDSSYIVDTKNFDIMKLLVKRGANIHATDKTYGTNVLAKNTDNPDIILYFLDLGVDPNQESTGKENINTMEAIFRYQNLREPANTKIADDGPQNFDEFFDDSFDDDDTERAKFIESMDMLMRKGIDLQVQTQRIWNDRFDIGIDFQNFIEVIIYYDLEKLLDTLFKFRLDDIGEQYYNDLLLFCTRHGAVGYVYFMLEKGAVANYKGNKPFKEAVSRFKHTNDENYLRIMDMLLKRKDVKKTLDRKAIDPDVWKKFMRFLGIDRAIEDVSKGNGLVANTINDFLFSKGKFSKKRYNF